MIQVGVEEKCFVGNYLLTYNIQPMTLLLEQDKLHAVHLLSDHKHEIP